MEFGSGKVKLQYDGYRADLVLDRPDKRNAIDRDVIDGLRAALSEISESEARAVALLGNGPVFCAGMDLDMMYSYSEEEHHDLGRDLHALFDEVAELDLPVVAGIKKAAIAGGFELTLPADLRIIDEEAKYGAIEINLGIFPSGGSTQRLPRLVGLSRAKEIVLKGEFIEPREAERIGLVNEVVGDAELVDERTRELCDELAEKAPLGMERALQAFRHAFDVPLEDGLRIERYLAKELYGTRDRKEGFQARIEGREPEFEGR